MSTGAASLLIASLLACPLSSEAVWCVVGGLVVCKLVVGVLVVCELVVGVGGVVVGVLPGIGQGYAWHHHNALPRG